ncbi:MAG TPA: hypothetical protein VG895_00580 [Patescibacteria group bacterium]|nr:hypothetical protein [Gammaproteobacteria bacterium]HWA51538.1 hypothetical protein [Patescibacteria group bacterium]
MEDQTSKKINLEQYRALLNAVSDEGVKFINEAIQSMMPAEHRTTETFYNVVLHIAAKAICTININDQEARKRGSDFFCEKLPKLVREARVLPVPAISKNRH